MLATGLMVTHGYITEGFMSWYRDDKFDIYMTLNRMFGPYAPAYWLLVACNVIVPQAIWFKRIRHESRRALRHCTARERRDVDGTLRHCHHEFASRFHALRMGHVSRDALGLNDVDRLVRLVFRVVFSLSARAASDLDQ